MLKCKGTIIVIVLILRSHWVFYPTCPRQAPRLKDQADEQVKEAGVSFNQSVVDLSLSNGG